MVIEGNAYPQSIDSRSDAAMQPEALGIGVTADRSQCKSFRARFYFSKSVLELGRYVFKSVRG